MHGFWLLMAGMLLVFSGEAMEAARQTAEVFARSVLPALFPMMVLGGLAGKQPAPARGSGLFLVLFGFCAGSPASARQAAALYERSAFPYRQLMPLLCMCGVMSPMFFTGSLAARLGSRTGWLMLAAHWAGALLTGCLCRLAYRSQRQSVQPEEGGSAASPMPSLSAALPEAIAAAARSLLSVLGAMMLFGILAAVTQALLGHLFPLWTAANRLPLAVMQALMEVGSGCFAALEAGAPPWLLCALCSFGGLSIWLQNLLFLGNMIRPAELLFWRALHGAVGGLCCYLFVMLCV